MQRLVCVFRVLLVSECDRVILFYSINSTVYRKSPQGRFSGFEFALSPPNPSFKVRYIDNSVDVCRIQLDIAPPVQGLGTQPVHARATAGPANRLQWQSS